MRLLREPDCFHRAWNDVFLGLRACGLTEAVAVLCAMARFDCGPFASASWGTRAREDACLVAEHVGDGPLSDLMHDMGISMSPADLRAALSEFSKRPARGTQLKLRRFFECRDYAAKVLETWDPLRVAVRAGDVFSSKSGDKAPDARLALQSRMDDTGKDLVRMLSFVLGPYRREYTRMAKLR